MSYTVTPPSQFSLSAGKISLGPIPDMERCKSLKQQGVSHIATVQTSDENAQQVKYIAQSAGINWLWLPFENTFKSSETELEHLRQYITEMRQFLNEGAHIYLHCDGSLKRCRLLFFALLHHMRVPSSSAYPILHSFNASGANLLPRRELHWAASLGSSARQI